MHKIMVSVFKFGLRIASGFHIIRFYPVRVIHKYLLKPFKSTVANVDGHKMFLDKEDIMCLSIAGIFEEFETELAKKHVKEGDVVLDIGANIGYYTLIFAKLVGPKGRVYAFEPDPYNFALLKKNVEMNRYKNVILIQKAVSNKKEKARLYMNKENKGDSRIFNSHDGSNSIEIESIRLDDYFKDHDVKIDFIKMDIEGSEGVLLEGMPNLLKKNKKIKIVTEFWPYGLEMSGTKSKDYIKSLTNHGFTLYSLNEQKKRIEPINIIKLLTKYTPKKQNYTNLLCIREK